jgi:hypothetical protein
MNVGGSHYQALAREARDYMQPHFKHLFLSISTSIEPVHIDWKVDDDQMTLFLNKTPRISARLQWIGVRTIVPNRWEWAWNITTLAPELVADAVKTRQFGEDKSIGELTTPILPDADQLCHDLTCIAAMLNSGESIWPLVREKGVFEYVVLHEIRQCNQDAA